jgi:hypothetical protein
MTIHRPLVVVHGGPMPVERNGLTAEDDAITARVQTCTQCGAHVFPLSQAVIYLGDFTVLATQCAPCRRQDPHMRALHALLVERYRPERWG